MFKVSICINFIYFFHIVCTDPKNRLVQFVKYYEHFRNKFFLYIYQWWKKQLALFYSPNNSTANALFELLKGLIPVQDKMYNLYKYEYWVEFGKDVRRALTAKPIVISRYICKVSKWEQQYVLYFILEITLKNYTVVKFWSKKYK